MDADKIKDFLLYNFEKGILAVVVAISGFLIYSGSQKPDITQKHDPERLVTNATEVRRQVDDDHTSRVVEERELFAVADKQQEFRNPIRAELYKPATAWDPTKVAAETVRRKDPELHQPVGVEVTGVLASVAYRSNDGSYRLAELEPADELEKVEQKPKRSRRRSREEEMMMGGGSAEEAMEMQMMMDEMMMMESSEMSGGSASGQSRQLDPEDNLGTKAAATRSLRNGDEQPPVPGVGLFIAGTAAIPHKQLIDSYQEALSNASGYDPMKRDKPLYVAYQVQRADVTNKSLDELTDADWVLRDSNEITIKNAALYWSGFAPEIVPADYWVPGVTMWIPPVLLDPYTDFATHPLVPLKSQRELEQEALLKESEQGTDSEPIDSDKFEVDVAGGQTRSFSGMDMMEMGMEEDMMGMEMGMEEEMMMGGGAGAGMAGKPAEDNPVNYKLLRFYDFAYIRGAPRDKNAPRRNRTYVYRIRFAVNDPNFPKDPELQPQGRQLDPDAYQRFISLSADAKQNNRRNFKRWSDWSELSAPVSLPSFDRSVVGPVKSDKARYVKAGNRRILVEPEPPQAEVVASSFDVRLGTFVPTRMKATEGTVLSDKVETADVIDPITLEVKKAEDKVIDSSATIIDVEGGAPLEIVEDEEMTEPGMFLMIDSQGNIQVKDSVEQQRLYRIRSFAEERGL